MTHAQSFVVNTFHVHAGFLHGEWWVGCWFGRDMKNTARFFSCFYLVVGVIFLSDEKKIDTLCLKVKTSFSTTYANLQNENYIYKITK